MHGALCAIRFICACFMSAIVAIGVKTLNVGWKQRLVIYRMQISDSIYQMFSELL